MALRRDATSFSTELSIEVGFIHSAPCIAIDITTMRTGIMFTVRQDTADLGNLSTVHVCHHHSNNQATSCLNTQQLRTACECLALRRLSPAIHLCIMLVIPAGLCTTI